MTTIAESFADLRARLEAIFERPIDQIVPVSMITDIAELCLVCKNARDDDQEKMQAQYLVEYARNVEMIMHRDRVDRDRADHDRAIVRYHDCAQLLLLAQCIYLFAPHASYHHGALASAQRHLDTVYNTLFSCE